MLVLHAGLSTNGMAIWGEASADGDSPAKKRTRSVKTKTPRLPFDAGPERLAAALADALPGFPYFVENGDQRFIWLPTTAGMPLASTPLIAPPPENGAPAELSAWQVLIVDLSSAQSLDLLGACVDRETLQPGIIVGATLAYWAKALRFAGSLLAREQFLPGLTDDPETPSACWQPVLAGADAARFAQLARAMPAGCRALSESAQAPPTNRSTTLLSAFLSRMIDTLVRSALGRQRPPAQTVNKQRQPAAKFESVHDHWLHGLRSSRSEMEAAACDLRLLADQLQSWRQPIAITAAAPYRLCFRLEEPREDQSEPGPNDADRLPSRPHDDPWQLRFFLQGLHDPSLLVPIADAWHGNGGTTLLTTDPPRAREYLLVALGQAAGVCPFVEESLKTKTPSGQKLDTLKAHEFLTERAGLLEQAGFGVLLPAWWSRKGTKVRLNLRGQVRSPKLTAATGITLDAIADFDWQVALGDEPLTIEELEVLARLKQPLVKVRGQWVQLSSAEIQAALDFWKTHGSDRAKVRDLVRMALGQAQLPGDLAFGGLTADGWIGDFLHQLEDHAGFAELPAPAEFRGTLRPYQQRGYSWLSFLRRWGLGACLADDMGLGKTVQTLALIQRDWADFPASGGCKSPGNEKASRRPTLLVCPMSVVGNWQKEAERFTPDLPVMVHHGLDRQKGRAFREQAEQHALVLSSYALLHRDFELLKEVSWAGIILDEAQNIKNSETKQARAARGIPADYRIALTGTPVENHVGDLWSLMEFLNPGFLGTHREFKRTFFVPIQAQQDPDASARLQRLTGPFILRRLKTDKSIISDLPDKLEMKVFCNLTKEQASLYSAVVKDMEEGLDASDGIQRKGIVLATLSKLKQVCNHPAQFLGDNSAIPGRSGKLARLTEMLEEVQAEGEGDRALVFTQFSEMGVILRKHLQETFGKEVLFLHGGVSKKQRDQMVERFQKDEFGPRIFLLSLKAGGTGLNLTAASHVFHFDRWWNPAVENQATDRAFRIGQKRKVQVHKFLCVGTLEEKIDAMIDSKQSLAQKVVGTGEAWLTEMSNEQLREVFSLRTQVLAE